MESGHTDFDDAKKFLAGRRVGGIVLGDYVHEIGFGSQGRVYQFSNKYFKTEGGPEFFAVKVTIYAKGEMEYAMVRGAQSEKNPSQHIVTIHGSVERKEKVCFVSILWLLLSAPLHSLMCTQNRTGSR